MIISGVTLIVKIANENEKSYESKGLLYLVPVCLVLGLYNVLYNNLLINLRFKTNISSRTFGLCIFKFVNYLICYCCLLKPCRD